MDAPSGSYWDVVGAQFAKNRLAVAGAWAVAGLVAVAVYAPLLALNRPFWFRLPPGVAAEPATRPWPFFMTLFDANFFENGVDFFFNTLMVLSPLLALVWGLARRRAGAGWADVRGRVAAGLCAVFLGTFLWLVTHPYQLPWYDYRAGVAGLRAAGVAVSAPFPPIPYSFREVDVGRAHPEAPSWAHPFGTDREGRDVFVRMVYGTRVSLTIGVVAVTIYVVIGVVLGATAGYFGGWVDLAISRFIEIVLCFPSFFLILTLAAFIEKRSIFHIMVIIGVIHWTGVARLVRGEFLHQRSLDYVQAAVALGFGRARIIFGHVLPNALAPVLVSATFGVAGAILTESSLSFLGLGDVTAPSWGGILAAGRVEAKLWLVLVPGLAIFFVVSLFNLVGEGLRDALDPKLRR